MHGNDSKKYAITEINSVKYAVIPVPEENLPVELPFDVEFVPTGESPLLKHEGFHKVTCPVCGKTEGVKRESDTMDTFVDSSWYFMRYADAKNAKEFASKESLNILPVDFYLGGDHITTHLIFARFFTKAMYDLGLINFEEPFLKFRYIGHILGEDGKKMSKRWGNVINPVDVVEAFGADTARTYIMFMGPLDVAKPWNTKSVEGVRRFYNRVWTLAEECLKSGIAESGNEAKRRVNALVKKVSKDIEEYKFNTAVSAFMEFTNFWQENKNEVGVDVLGTFLKVLHPFAPHITEELWEKCGNYGLIERQMWPVYDASLVVDDFVTVVIQVNGKVRGRVEVESARISDKDYVLEKAMHAEKVREILQDVKVKESFYVPGRLVNFVV